MKLRNVLVVHKIGYTEEEKKTIQHILALLSLHAISYRLISLLEVHPSMIHDRDLIISIGGDGTFLKTAHAVEKQIPFLSINADPTKTEGFFSQTTAKNAEKKILDIMKNKCHPKQLSRLQATVNNIPIEPAMNEYYIGEQKPYHVSKYSLTIGNKQENQKSSGILICTAAGSTAWCRSAFGKVMKLDAQQFQFVVREPYIGKLTKTKIKKGILNKNEVVTITPFSSTMILVSDAVGKEHTLPLNAKIIIKKKETPLLLFY